MLTPLQTQQKLREVFERAHIDPKTKSALKCEQFFLHGVYSERGTMIPLMFEACVFSQRSILSLVLPPEGVKPKRLRDITPTVLSTTVEPSAKFVVGSAPKPRSSWLKKSAAVVGTVLAACLAYYIGSGKFGLLP